MASLIPAHRGYEYQDLLVACRLVDVLLGNVVQVHVDEKLTDNDAFDDLSTIDVDGRRERNQFKHTENGDRPLSLATFTTEARDLRLDRVITSVLADRSGPGHRPAKHFHRHARVARVRRPFCVPASAEGYGEARRSARRITRARRRLGGRQHRGQIPAAQSRAGRRIAGLFGPLPVAS